MSIEKLGVDSKDFQIIHKRHKKMKERDIERLSANKIYITKYRFICTKCGGSYLTRRRQNGVAKQMIFRCKNCKQHSKEIYDKKTGRYIGFEEYRKIADKIEKGEENV